MNQWVLKLRGFTIWPEGSQCDRPALSDNATDVDAGTHFRSNIEIARVLRARCRVSSDRLFIHDAVDITAGESQN